MLFRSAFFSWRLVTRVNESCQKDARRSRIATNLIAPLLCIIIYCFNDICFRFFVPKLGGMAYLPQNRAQIYDIFSINKEIPSFCRLLERFYEKYQNTFLIL